MVVVSAKFDIVVLLPAPAVAVDIADADDVLLYATSWMALISVNQ